MTALRHVSFLLLPLLFLPGPLHPATAGQIQGHVFDPRGGTVAGVSVTVTNVMSAAQFETQTDAAGAYRLPHLDAGEYRVAATHPQFRAVRVRAVVVGGQAIEVDLRFPEVADRGETITVTAEPLAVDLSSAGVQSGYSAVDVLRTPGASDSLLALLAHTGTAWYSQEHLHIRGAHQVGYEVNGLEIPDLSLFGAVTPIIDPRNVNFTEVTSGGLLPQYGNRTAGIVNSVTRSGFDEGTRRGQLEIAGGNLKRASAFAAYGGRVGEKLGYYVQGGALASGRGFNPPPDAINPDAILRAPVDQTRHNFRRTYQSFGNFDYRQSPKSYWNLTVGAYHTDLQVPNTLQQQQFGRDYVQFERDGFLNLQWNRILSAGSLLTLAGFSHYNRVAVEARHDAPDLPLAGDNRRAAYVGGRADLSRHSARHFFKAGVTAYRGDVSDTFVIGNPLPYASRVPSRAIEESFYAQDQWRASEELTLTYGGRLDLFQARYGGTLSRDYSFLSPRLGFAYRLGRTQMALFGNFAYLFLPPPLEFFELRRNGLFPEGVSFTHTKPERDVQYDFGLKFQVHGFHVRANQWFKRQIRFLDHVQLTQLKGAALINTNIFLPVNLDRARSYGGELFLQSPERRGLSLFVNYAYNRAQGYGGIVGGFRNGTDSEARYFSLDHDQRHTAYAGMTWFCERMRLFVTTLYAYGSGFPDTSADLLAPFFGGTPRCARPNCRLPQHQTLSFSVGKSIGEQLTLRFEIENVTNSVYPINLGSEFNGSHFSAPRQASVWLTYHF